MTPPSVGNRIPRVSLQTLDGTAAPLTRWQGRPLLLTFLRHPG